MPKGEQRGILSRLRRTYESGGAEGFLLSQLMVQR